MRPLLVHTSLPWLVVLAMCCAAFSQVDYATGSLRGTVSDPQGAVIAGATVTVAGSPEKITRVAKTGSDGQYQVPALPPGIYQITFEAQGFGQKVAKDIELKGGQTLSYDASLAVLEPKPAAEARHQQLQVIAPDIVPQGEVFTIRVVEDSDAGQVPVRPGSEVVVNGTVVEAQEGGKIRVPAFAEKADQFLWVAIHKAAESPGASATTAASPQHVEVVRLPQPPNQLPSNIWHVSELSPSGGDIRVDGQGLDGLQNASLQAGASSYPLSDSVGSSLQRIYRCPQDLPKGGYHFVAQDASGQKVEAPNATTNPTLTITGTQIRRRGQRGKFVVTSDVEGEVQLSGGEPIIQLDTRVVHVSPNKPATVGFTAAQVGEYDLHALLQAPETTPATAPHAEANVGKLQTQFNPAENKTSVSAPIRVTGEQGQAVGNSGVDVALVGPAGIQYTRLTTDKNGDANFQASLTGDVTNSLALYSFRVLRHRLGQPPPKGPVAGGGGNPPAGGQGNAPAPGPAGQTGGKADTVKSDNDKQNVQQKLKELDDLLDAALHALDQYHDEETYNTLQEFKKKKRALLASAPFIQTTVLGVTVATWMEFYESADSKVDAALASLLRYGTTVDKAEKRKLIEDAKKEKERIEE